MTTTNLQYPILRRELQRQYNYFWEHDKIQEQKFKQILGRTKSFKNCFGSNGLNLTKPFIDDISRRTKGEIPLSLVIQIRGLQGSGKSKLSFQIAKIISGKLFSAKHIFLDREKMLNSLDKTKRNETYILDEQRLDYGEGSQRQLAEIQNIQEITRIKQVHFIYNSPTEREHLAAHYSLEILQQNTKYRITKFAFCSNDFSYYYGYGLAKIPLDTDDKIYLDYEPRKLEFVQKVLERKTQKIDIWGMAQKLRSNPKVKYCKTKQDLTVIATELYPTLTTGEIKRIISASFILMREQIKSKSG